MDVGPWIPTITSIVGALVAGGFALWASRTNVANQRIIELEKRLATSRLDAYRPLMEAMAEYFNKKDLTPQEEKRRNERHLKALHDAALWIPIYGSDETVKVFHRMMQVAFSGAPGAIMLRMWGQFMLAVRRDLGDTTTDVSLVDLLGIRINDMYSGDSARWMRLSDDEYYARHGWTPPWRSAE